MWMPSRFVTQHPLEHWTYKVSLLSVLKCQPEFIQVINVKVVIVSLDIACAEVTFDCASWEYNSYHKKECIDEAMSSIYDLDLLDVRGVDNEFKTQR